VKSDIVQEHIEVNMRLPNYRRIFSNDFDSQFKELLDKLSGTLNSGIEVIYEALNNKLTFRDNFAATVAEFTVTVDNNGIPTGTTSFKLSNSLKIEGLFVISATDTSNATLYPPGSVFVSGNPSNTSYIISNIRGLTPGREYRIKVVVLN